MKLNIIASLVCVFLTTSALAQKQQENSAKGNRVVKTDNNALPKGKYVYFPDYYAFYDPNRGYVFWSVDSSGWQSSRELPSFMSKIDFRKTRIKILDGLSLDLYPERNYPNYMKLYPARQNDPKVPVPGVRPGGSSRY